MSSTATEAAPAFDYLTDYQNAIRRLGPDGNLYPGVDAPTLDLNLAAEALRWMKLSRLTDERAFNLQRQGRLGTFSPTKGQEASVLGVALALDPGRDWLVPQYRELAAVLYHGFPLDQWFSYWMGSLSSTIPAEVRILPFQISLAAQIPHAMGLAWGRALQGSGDVVACFFGDGASSEGDFHEALNFAGVMKAPVIFVLQNNGWAISTPREKQSAAATLASRAVGYGIAGALVDGNDLFAVHEVAQQAVRRARAGEGPTLIESVTYRLGPHNTADDHTRYVPDGEIASHEPNDPILRVSNYLRAQGVWDDEKEAATTAAHTQSIAEAVAVAEASTTQPLDIFDHVYHEPPARLVAQRATAERRYAR
ncbi:thiamine pyrophosphate-dependent enzyme [Mycolicibacterium sp.]|uniref:thiamine pyrophosphate-dependent enzyme n=1 Tax=Mycolicibacterium sp. TaxID=2320850 RepID=UPI0037CCB53A